ncbi:hypothetical protein BCT84_02625 [Vibrio breoganii]|nr:hypothetical protein BCT84_02625 [Vibrio breoganii]
MTERSTKDINLIWTWTHRDFKGSCSKTKSIMWPAPHHCLGPISELPEKEFQDALKYALHKEVCKARDEKLIPILKRFDLWEHGFSGTEQWRECLHDVLTFTSFTQPEKTLHELRAAIEHANVPFPK